MYKRKSFVILTLTLIFSAVFFFIGFFGSFKPSRAGVDAGSIFDNHFVQRFEKIELEGDGSIDLSSNGKGQYFNLQSRHLTNNGFETSDRPMSPVFSEKEMYSIEEYNPKIYTQAQNDAGFVIIDDTGYNNGSEIFRNYVVLEVQKLESVSIGSPGYAKLNGAAINLVASSAVTSDAKLIESLSNPNKVLYDTNSICAAFNLPGYYEFEITGYAQGTHQWKEVYLKFGFFIASAGDYSEDAMPVIKLNAAGQPIGEYSGVTRKYNPSNTMNPAIPGNGDSYYYQIQNVFQSINYVSNRFDMTVEKSINGEWDSLNDNITNDGANKKKYTFESLGTYKITAQMTFPYAQSQTGVVVIPESRYNTHYYYMNIFGYQSYYQVGQEQSERWFGSVNGTNSDISVNFNPVDANYNLNGLSGQPQTNKADSAIRWLVNDGNAAGIKNLDPVVTNMPPVALRGNVLQAYQDQQLKINILSRVAFKAYGSTTWQYKEYNTDGLFYDAGEYAVILYYRYDVANKTSEPENVYMQMFYFKIDNFCADVSITYGAEKLTFSEFLGRKVYTSSTGFGFEFNGAGVSPYGVVPRIGLTFKPADTSAPILSYLNFITNQSSIISQVTTLSGGLRYWKDGTYTWQVYYYDVSGRFVPHGEFVVIVDSTSITDFSCVSTGVKLPSQYMPSGAGNISVFGAGEVTLSWGIKKSGIGMKIAELDYFETRESNWTALETTTSSSSIGGSHEILSKVSKTIHINEITNKSGVVTGYTIAERMTASGIYMIKVTDDADNTSYYTFIIDNSTPRFAQSKSINPQNQLNVQTGPVTVGFGNRKLVYRYADIVPPVLQGVGPIVNGTAGQFSLLTTGIYIPIIKKEESTNGVNFVEIPVGTITRTLNTEGMYFYRITDALGNVKTHYVQISNDLTQPILLEDDLPNSELSPTATMVMNGGISNRDYLTFSVQQANNTAAQDYVHTVKIAFYDMTFNVLNKSGYTNTNYPFSDEVTYTEVINIASKYPGIVNERLFINVNQTPITRQGLYVISRICNNRSDSNRVKNFYFIVDRNTVISSTNYESGIKATFGTGSDTKVATYKNFQKDVSTYIADDGKLRLGNHKILQGNHGVVISLPVYKNWTVRDVGLVAGGTVTSGWNSNNYSNGTKYGNSVFNILTGDFSASQNVAFNSLKLTQTVYRQDSVSKVFGPYTSSLTTSGLYSVAFADGSGGVPWMLGSTFETPEKNRSEMLIELFINMPQGAFILNGTQISASDWQPSQPIDPTAANPSISMASSRLNLAQPNTLKFSFSNDSESFLHTIATNGEHEPVVKHNNTVLDRVTAPITSYVSGSLTTWEITMPMRVYGVNVKSGDIFTVTLKTVGGKLPIQYMLVIDNSMPFYNLERIMNSTGGDKWFVNKTGYLEYREKVQQVAGGNMETPDNPLKYPFAISNSFAFERAGESFTYSKGNPNFDTYRLSYYEVNSRLSNISGETVINYGNTPFSQIVKLASTENRFFRIVEYDEIGNRTEYFVQLRGADYVDNMTLSGLTEYSNYFDNTRPTGNWITDNMLKRRKITNGQYEYAQARGIDLSVAADGLQDFFNNNLFFEMKWNTGSTEYRIQRFGIEPTVPASVKENLFIIRTVGEFTTAVQKILDLTKNAPVELKVDNRFAEYSVKVRQIDRNNSGLYLGNPQLASSTDVWIPVGAFGEGISSFYDSGFWADVYEYQSGATGAWTIYPFISFLNSGFILENSVFSDLLIVVYDEFGRLVKTAYNGRYGSEINLSGGGIYAGNDLYYGKSGAAITYVESAYEWFYLYRNNELVYINGNSVGGFDANDIVITDWANQSINTKKVTILPEMGLKTSWRVVAIMRGVPEKTWVREFNFYEVLPEISFSSPSGDTLNINEDITGIVVVTYSNNGLLFTASAGYWWTPMDGGSSVYTPIGAYMPKFNLSASGYYEVQIVNTLGANITYSFTILDSSNRSFKVYTKDTNNQLKEILASPQRYTHQGTKIPNYFVVSFDNVSVMPTSNNDYHVQGFETIGSTRVYTLKSDTTNGVLMVAVTGVESNMNTISVAASASAGWTRTDGAENKYVSFHNPNSGGKLAEGTITVGLSGLVGNYNAETGNYAYMEYYRNGTKDGINGDLGEYCGTLIGAQSLSINAKDYGYYTFYVYDHAGNVKKFGNNKDLDYFTVINMGRGPLVISSFVDGFTKQESIIDDMVYNDLVSLSVMPLPFNAYAGTGTARYPYASRLVIWKNNDVYLTYSAKDMSEAVYGWILNEPGFYRIEFEYTLAFNEVIISRHAFTLVSTTEWQQGFSFNASSKMEIIGLTLNGADIRKNYSDKTLKSISVNTSTGTGVYKMTVRMDADNIYTSVRTREITVRIRSLTGIGITFNGVEFGGSTSKKVQINWIPSVIYNLYGDTEIWVMRDGKNPEIITIKPDEETGQLENFTSSVSHTGAGTYSVFLVSAGAEYYDGIFTSGYVYFQEGFKINETMNFLSILFIILGLSAVGVTLFIFIKMRIGMRVK